MNALAIIGCTIGGAVVGGVIGVMASEGGYMDFSAAFNGMAGIMVGGVIGVVVGSVIFT